MISEKLDNDLANLKQQAHQYLIQGNYAQAASCFEQAIAIEANNKSNYWHLGLIFLLQQQEEEAQMTGLLGVADGEPEEIELWTEELVAVSYTHLTLPTICRVYSSAVAISFIRKNNSI